ncbi:MAG: hypothetical protein Q9207_004861, partial [Kuettlingeria erythrocarpa]
MRHGSLDEEALWDGIKLQENRALPGYGRHDASDAGVVTDIEGGVRSPKETSGAKSLAGEGEANESPLEREKVAQRDGIFTS